MKTKLILSIIFCGPLFLMLKMAMYFLVGILFDSFLAVYLSTPILFILLGLSDILAALLIAYLFCLFNKERMSSIISFDKNWGKYLLFGGLVGFLSVSLGFIIIYLTKNISIESIPIRWLYIGTSFIMVVFTATSEEILFRGLMQNKLTKISNPAISIIITSAIFALLHIFGNDASLLFIVNVFIVSIVLGITYLYTKNIFFPIGFHIFWNFAIDISEMSNNNVPSMFFSNISSENLINGGQGGFEYSIICTVISLFLTAFFSYKMFFATKALRKRL